MFVGRNGREDQRHALVRGVALREHVAENDQVIDLRKAGIRLAVVTVQLPVHRTRGFADDVDVYLAPRCLGRARRTVGEILRGLLEIVGLAEFRGTQVYVVEHVEREDLVPQHVPVFAHAVGRPQRQHAQRHEHRPGQSDVHARGARYLPFVPDFARGEPQQRQVHHADQDHGGVDVAQQLARFARVGRHQVGEHVRGDDRVAEEVQQHDLERAQENERERQPDHYARTAQRHAPHHVKSQRHQYQRLDRPDGVGFGIGQHAVGDNQRDKEIDGQQRGETAAGFDRPLPVMFVRISIHIVTLT